MCETKWLIIPKLDSKNFYILIFLLASLSRRLVPKLVKKIEDKTHGNNLDDKPAENFIYFFNIISNLININNIKT